MTDEPWSTWTAVSYIVAGAALATLGPPEGPLLFAGFLFLGVATALFHAEWSPATADLDHLGMIFLLLLMAGLAAGAPWWLVTVVSGGLAYLLVYVTGSYSHPLILTLSVLLLLVLAGQGAWFEVGMGSAQVLVALVIRQFWHTDFGHGLWHLLSSAGLLTAATGIFP